MAKTKIVLTDETYVVADQTVAEVTTALAEGGNVEFPVTVKDYNYALNTINIGEKTEPAYREKHTTKVVNASHVQRVEEAVIPNTNM